MRKDQCQVATKKLILNSADIIEDVQAGIILLYHNFVASVITFCGDWKIFVVGRGDNKFMS